MMTLCIFVHKELDQGCHSSAPSPITFSMCPEECVHGLSGPCKHRCCHLPPKSTSSMTRRSLSGMSSGARSLQWPAKPPHRTVFDALIRILRSCGCSRHLPWLWASLITPALCTCHCFPFFGLCCFRTSLQWTFFLNVFHPWPTSQPPTSRARAHTEKHRHTQKFPFLSIQPKTLSVGKPSTWLILRFPPWWATLTAMTLFSDHLENLQNRREEKNLFKCAFVYVLLFKISPLAQKQEGKSPLVPTSCLLFVLYNYRMRIVWVICYSGNQDLA